MTATNYGHSGALGPRTADSPESTGLSHAPFLHCPLLAWDSGEFRRRVFELRPCGMAACSSVKHSLWTCTDSLAYPYHATPGSSCSSCTMHVLSASWILDILNWGGLPCACLEYPAEGLLTSDTLVCPRTLALPLVLPFPGTEVQMWTCDSGEQA